MSTIKTRQTTATGVTNKGAPLSNAELDANFVNLNTDKMEKASNLGDLSNKSTARSNLDVLSSAQTTNEAIAMAIALG